MSRGYWKYIPQDADSHTIRFLTAYDYEVRFGFLGRLFDCLVFRPLLGWATAWSFDRLRLWIEKDVAPAASMRQSLIYLVSRLSLVFVWIYQGLIPKVLSQNPDELRMLRAAGLTNSLPSIACTWMGWAEIILGLILLFAWRSIWPVWLTFFAMPVATLGVAMTSPDFLGAAFNPISLNLGVAALAVTVLIASHDIPSAGRCVRRLPRGTT